MPGTFFGEYVKVTGVCQRDGPNDSIGFALQSQRIAGVHDMVGIEMILQAPEHGHLSRSQVGLH